MTGGEPAGCRWCGSTEGVEGSGYCGVCLAHLPEPWEDAEEEEEEAEAL